jgi:hypothetical protein
MRRHWIAALIALFVVAVVAIAVMRAGPSTGAAGALSAFKSDAELRSFLRRVNLTNRREPGIAETMAVADSAAASAPPPKAMAAAAPSEPGITNNQIANVDEGDIVKRHGDMLVILRRGRLFTVSLAGGRLRPVAMIDAWPPGIDASADWYDEMLVSGDRVIVIGYSYGRGGTEVNRFRIDGAGKLSFEDAYQLRSGDYYSARNYASRLIGTTLVLYSPLDLGWGKDPLAALPAMRHWRRNAKAGGDFRRIVDAGQVYVPPALRNPSVANIDTMHSVTRCDLAAPLLDCKSTVVLGSTSRNFFAGEDAIYLWVNDAWRAHRGDGRGFLYRIPLDGGAPTAAGVRGAPVDQFSFYPDQKRGLMRILIRAEGGGDRMWSPEVTDGSVALLSIPPERFGDGREVPRTDYRPLPKPEGESWSFQNRFIGDLLLYAGGEYGSNRPATLYTAPLGGGPVEKLSLRHAIERIEPIGPDAMIVGEGRRGLGFTAVSLSPRRGWLGESFTLPDAAQGESRSHGFYFRPDPGSADGGSGVMGIPVAREIEDPTDRMLGSSAAILFLDRQKGKLSPAGELTATPIKDHSNTDDCVASCVDWYGNARPIFIDNRILALLGYELVEGRRQRDQIGELRRTNFEPR